MKNNSELKLGIVGLDGHGPVFAQAINGPKSVLSGMRVVTAMSVPSVMISEKELSENIEKTRALGIRITTTPEELASGVDGVLILHDDGSKHLELVKQFVDKGKPLFVDKPLEASPLKAGELTELCQKYGCPVFTASSLRFSKEIMTIINNAAAGKIVSAMTYSPYVVKPTMPGWTYYGVHAVEPLYALMGPGCREVRCVPHRYGPVAIGTWEDGRMGIAKGITNAYHGFGFAVWCENTDEVVAVDSSRIYPELLKNIKYFFETKSSPVNIEESLEVIAFMEAANESMANDGEAIPVKML